MAVKLRRPSLAPPLGDAVTSVDAVIEHLRAWKVDTAETRAQLQTLRADVAENTGQLENPRAVLEYLDFFDGFLERAAADLDQIERELPTGVTPEHVAALRQIASNAAAEQRRCVTFRDKWINRPLPYEQQRPLLNRISNDTRDQLLDYRDLNVAADQLKALGAKSAGGPAQPAAPELQSPDRRALFTRWFGK